MIIQKETIADQPLTVDLTGPDGNVFVLMGYARQLAKGGYSQLGHTGKEICDDMMSGDYEHAVAVMEREFGDSIILIR